MKATLCNNHGQIFWQTDKPLDAMPLGDYAHTPELRELIEAARQAHEWMREYNFAAATRARLDAALAKVGAP